MIDLITDRTEADVLSGGIAGGYSYNDLNRVEEAVQFLDLLAQDLDIHLDLLTKTDWGPPEEFSAETWPVDSQMARYLGNVKALCTSMNLDVPLPATMRFLTVEGANNIERALEKVCEHIQNIIQTYQYSGELFAGEEI